MQEKVKIRVTPNQYVKGTLIVPNNLKEKRPAFIFIHGWASSEKGYIQRAKAAIENQAIALTLNLRGHGLSDGKLEEFSRADHLADIIATYKFLIKQPYVDKHKIGLVGSSYGGYLATIATSKLSINYLALRAPALYQDKNFHIPTAELNKTDERVYRQQNLKANDNLALKALSHYKGHLLLIESEKDQVCPHATLQNYLKNTHPQTKVNHQIIRGAKHILDVKSNQVFIQILSQWIKEVINF